MDIDALSAAGALQTDPLEKPTVTNGVKHAGDDHINGVVTHGQQKPANWVDVRDEFLGKPHRRLRVITIGAGFSGMLDGPPAQKRGNEWSISLRISGRSHPCK